MVSIDAGRSRTRHREGIHWLRLAMRLTGGLVLLAALFVGLALASYDRHDPSWNHAVAGPVTNLMALPGAQLADALLQAFGAAAVLVPLFLADWAARLMTGHGRRRFWLKLLLAPWTVPLAALALSILPAPWWWPIRSGIGGFIGQLARQGAGHLDIAPP
ncbi:MAG: DNA translocase FtsK 4TM domain-containing protein, partial [Alphaproteobacteria bacterium]|nr:DNA translocase FtsK 4TM domain-containing protein [Alphaproteobacteria bacterium]